MISLGIIGPGLIWEHTHRDIIAGLRDTFAVRAVAARSRVNQDRGRGAYPEANIYGDADELIADPAVEAVVILTPIALNAPTAHKALEAGKHAVVEKPVARSRSEARALAERAKTAPGVLYILEQHVHKGMIAAVRSHIDAGEIGEVVSFERSLHVRIAETNDQTGGYGKTSWRIEPDYPLGNFFDGGIHEIALMQELFGPAEAIYGRGRSLREGFGEVDLLSMVVEYPGGIQGTFSHSASLGRQGNSFVIHGTTGALECTDRAITRIDAANGETAVHTVEPKNESVTMWEEVGRVLADRRPGRYTPEKAQNDVALMDALQASLRDGRRVAIR